jgi:regulator of nucleoside diphosphate kinase
MKRKRCFVTDSDRCRLGVLLSSSECKAWGPASHIHALNARLEDAAAVGEENTPHCLVTMNSTIELTEIDSGLRRRVTLAYPEDCELLPGSISVFDRLGTQLLGSEIGDLVQDGVRSFRVSRILYQPETAGDHHL